MLQRLHGVMMTLRRCHSEVHVTQADVRCCIRDKSSSLLHRQGYLRNKADSEQVFHPDCKSFLIHHG